MRILYLLLFISFLSTATAQNLKGLVSGPWAGNVELRNATIWAEVSPAVKKVAVKYSSLNKPSISTIVHYKGSLGNAFNPVKIELNGLDFNTTYAYQLVLDDKPVITPFPTRFVTKDLWQWRKPAPDFSFLAGSCSYFNEPVFDRPGIPYGADSSIFNTMASQEAAFHIWMGDNWYTREVDFYTTWGLNYRASRDRAQAVVQKFMAAMPQYAIWDDHDYGPNDIGKSFIHKEESRKIFEKYSLNPSYGEDGKGIYTKFSYGDVDFFLTDNRYFRSEDAMPDSINGQPSPTKTYFGRTQMEWLKNALVYSRAPFKIIVSGNQVLNPLGRSSRMHNFSFEYNELLDFITQKNLNGVIFFSGDRHHSEVIKVQRPGNYTFFDVTISPYTAGVSKVSGAEVNSPYRVEGTLIEAQNFGRINISGNRNERILEVNFVGLKGELLGSWKVSENDLKNKR